MTILTKHRALALLEAAVAERGDDYVYPEELKNGPGHTCQYFLDGQSDPEDAGKPGCIVGYLLHGLGFTADDVSSWEGNASSTVLRWLGVTVDPELDQALAEAQDYQDNGGTWGKAVRLFTQKMFPDTHGA